MYDIRVTFSGAPAMTEIVSRMKDTTWMYTVEILPPTSKSSVKPVCMIDCQEDCMTDNDINHVYEEDNTEREMTKLTISPSKRMHVTLEGLDIFTEYSICVSTIVNGRRVAQRSKRIEPKM